MGQFFQCVSIEEVVVFDIDEWWPWVLFFMCYCVGIKNCLDWFSGLLFDVIYFNDCAGDGGREVIKDGVRVVVGIEEMYVNSFIIKLGIEYVDQNKILVILYRNS